MNFCEYCSELMLKVKLKNPNSLLCNKLKCKTCGYETSKEWEKIELEKWYYDRESNTVLV